MCRTDFVRGIVAVTAFSLLFVGGVSVANELDIELDLKIGVAPQLAIESAVDLGVRLGRATVTSETDIGIWPGFYASESLDLEYRLGRVNMHLGGDIFLVPFMFETVSFGADYTLLDWQDVERFLQRFTLAAGGDFVWYPYGGFGIAPSVQAWLWTRPADCYIVLGLRDVLTLSVQTEWPILDWMDLAVGAEVAVAWGGIDFDFILGFSAQIDLPLGEQEPPAPTSEDPDVSLDVDSFYARPSKTGETITFGYAGTGVASYLDVTIYDLTGHTVRTLRAHDSRTVEWDGTDEAGNLLGRGHYIYTIDVGDRTEFFTGKDMVVIKR